LGTALHIRTLLRSKFHIMCGASSARSRRGRAHPDELQPQLSTGSVGVVRPNPGRHGTHLPGRAALIRLVGYIGAVGNRPHEHAHPLAASLSCTRRSVVDAPSTPSGAVTVAGVVSSSCVRDACSTWRRCESPGVHAHAVTSVGHTSVRGLWPPDGPTSARISGAAGQVGSDPVHPHVLSPAV
jgi:hypothetical protein